jgi:hypothetical protein
LIRLPFVSDASQASSLCHALLCRLPTHVSVDNISPLTSISSPNPQSSAANRGLFETLNTHKRGSQDYTERRASYTEMAGNSPGLVSGWFNKTFKGMEKPANVSNAALGNDGKMMSAEQKRVEERRGVME